MSNQESEALYRGKRHYDKDGKPLGGIKVMVDDAYMVEVEGGEYKICNDAYNSDEVLSFKDKTNKEILDYIHNDFSCKFEQSKADSGDFILCRLVVNDKKKKNYSGTVRQVLDMMQSEHSCRVSFGDKSMKKGGEISPEEIEARWRKKKESIERLSEKIRSLRNNLTRDIKGEDERERLTALAISVIDKTAERVGNSDSEENGHFGVTGFKKKHIKVDGNTVYLNYIGKSGVKHEKQFSDELIAGALKQAMKNSSCEYVFCTADGFRIKPEKINRYLSDYGVTAKDIRGYSANRWIVDKLNNIDKSDIPETEAKRKRRFNQVLKSVAAKVGHGSGTLKKHYMIPELESAFVEGGEILDLSNFYSKGGYVRLSKTPAPKSDRIYGSKKNAPQSAASKSSGKNIDLSSSVVSSILKKLKEHNTKHPDKKITLGVAKAVVRRGMGAYSVTHRPTIRGGQPNSRVAWGLARLNAFLIKAATGKSKSGRYSQDNDLLNELNIPHKKYEDGGGIRSFIDDGNKLVVYQKNNYKIAVNNVNDADYITLWRKDAVSQKDKKIGYLKLNKTEDGFLKISEVSIEKNERGLGFGLELYRTALKYSSDDVLGIKSYLPDRSNKAQVPKIYRRLKAIEKDDWAYILKEEGGQLKRHIVGCLIYSPEQGFLILQRGDDCEKNAGKWHILSGGVDDGEELEMTALREIEEEIGFDGEMELEELATYDFGDYNFTYFLAIPKEAIIAELNYENKDFAWVNSIDEMLSYDLIPQLKDYMVEFNKGFSGIKSDVRLSEGGELLLAPNGKPSNLTPEQWNLVRTPAFKAWFGDWENDPENSSKVLDENGEPLVVYHGGADSIDVFDERYGGDTTGNNEHGAFFFTNKKEVAEDYSRQAIIRRYEGRDEEELINYYKELSEGDVKEILDDLESFAESKIKIVTAFLNIRSPFIDNSYHGKVLDTLKLQRQIGYVKKGIDENYEFSDTDYVYDQDVVDSYKKEIEERAREDNSLEEDDEIEYWMLEDAKYRVLEENGVYPELKKYDGVIVLNVVDDIGDASRVLQDEYIALRPNQIKDATGMNTSFSDSDEIFYNKGGSVDISCIDFIRKTESILKNGYYHRFGSFCLITYNSGNQKDLNVYQTVNLVLSQSLSEVLKIDEESARNLISNYYDNARRVDTLDIINELKDCDIVIADRDKIVCSNNMLFDKEDEILLAPNGKPSNLTPEQWHLVRTPAFKAWFGDWENDPENASKVVDENGEPMICFHGTNSNPFYVFDEKKIGRLDAGYYGRGFYFVFYPFNPKLAKGEASYYGKNIIGAFLNARNPFDISTLSEYKGQKISTIGAESAVFIRNIARMFPEVNFYGARKIEYGETNDDGSVSIVSTDVSSNDYAELFDKYDKEIEWIDSGDRLLALVDGKVVERLELIQKNRENGFYGDNLNMAKAILIDKVIEQIHKIGVVYMPEGIMTRNPEITTLLRDGHDAIMQSKQGDEVVVFGANQIKLADGTNTTFDGDNPDIRYEDGGEILSQNKLIALHNISPNQIKDVDYMGGMITPSVAILKAGEPYYDFGTITLIADKELIDPQQYGVRVFSGDVYSPSVPRKEYYIDKKIEKKIRELVSKAYSYNSALGNVLENLIDDISPFYKDMKRMSRAELIERYFDKLKIAFLIDKGVKFDVPFTRVKSYLWGNTELEVPESEIERAKELLGRYRKETEASSSELTDETRREILAFFKKIVESIKEKESVGSGVAIKEEMREAYSNIVRDTYSKLIERYIGDETFLSPHAIDKLGQVVYGKKELDKEALQISVESLFDESLNKEYRDWLESYIYKYQGSAYFEKGKSKIPYNLENLVEASINRTRGEEKLLTYGYNKAKSFGLKEFSSIDSMRKLSNILVSKEEMDRVDEENKEGFFELSKILKSSQREWDKLDSLGKALADYFKGSSARSALSKNGFIIRFESELDDFKSYAEKLKKSPVDYFEAKLLRAVKLSEFKYAVVPDNLEKEIVEILEMNNLPVLYYKAEDNKDRAEKVMQAATEGDLIFKRGGLITEENRELYKEWKRLVNMTASEIKKFYQSEEGKEAGLKPSEAKDLGIHYGRESARWIIKMKKTPVAKWTPTMWEWAKRQIRFNSRMLGNRGALYDEKGNKTRKHTSLLIWGHNPEKKENGGYVNEGGKSRAKYFSDLVDFIYSIFECEYLGNSVDRSCVIYKLNKTENSEELFVLLRSKIEREGFDFIDLNGSKISNSGKELIIKVT